MADSDEDYIADNFSDEEIDTSLRTNNHAHGTRSTGPADGPNGSSTRGGDTNAGTGRKKAAWEDIQRSWDTVVEVDGSINSAVERERERKKR